MRPPTETEAAQGGVQPCVQVVDANTVHTIAPVVRPGTEGGGGHCVSGAEARVLLGASVIDWAHAWFFVVWRGRSCRNLKPFVVETVVASIHFQTHLDQHARNATYTRKRRLPWCKASWMARTVCCLPMASPTQVCYVNARVCVCVYLMSERHDMVRTPAHTRTHPHTPAHTKCKHAYPHMTRF